MSYFLKKISSNKILLKRSKYLDLINELEKAEKILSEYSGGHSGDYFCATDFNKDYVLNLNKIKSDFNMNLKPDLGFMYRSFLPTCEWDDFVGSEGINIANRILKKIEKLKK